jgi:hypothetical protein
LAYPNQHGDYAEAATQLASYFAFALSPVSADGFRLSMSLAGVEIKGLGRARLVLGRIEQRLEYDDGQIEKQHRQSLSFTALRPFPLTT